MAHALDYAKRIRHILNWHRKYASCLQFFPCSTLSNIYIILDLFCVMHFPFTPKEMITKATTYHKSSARHMTYGKLKDVIGLVWFVLHRINNNWWAKHDGIWNIPFQTGLGIIHILQYLFYKFLSMSPRLICIHLNSYLIIMVLPSYSFQDEIVCFLITGDRFMKKWPGVDISMINNIFHGSESYTGGNLFFPAYT